MLSPNDMYAVQVARSGYRPVPLSPVQNRFQAEARRTRRRAGDLAEDGEEAGVAVRRRVDGLRE
ncbi:hypothetical protein ACKI1O_45005 [Streptomyces scabiei]